MRLEPVPDEAALRVDDQTLVLTDLHLGREVELRERGFIMPHQAEKITDHVVTLLRDQAAQRLIILGDLKHRVARLSGLERRDLPHFIAAVGRTVPEVHVIRGNHDVGLEYYLPASIHLHPSSGFALQGVGYCHGHTWPTPEVMATEVLVMGHNHPTVLFQDRLGVRSSQRCWVRLNFKGGDGRYMRVPREAIVVPAFNEFSGGTNFNEAGTRLLGPLLRSDLLDIPEARIYLLDGTYLGLLRNLLVPGREEGRRRGG